jgi:ATP-independent RNA helicase DbpA
MNDFAKLPLSPAMITNLDAMGYTTMTPVQAESIPHVLQGEDVLAQAKTGSGKTAAFGIGALHRLKTAQFDVQTLVLCPTRELSEQVSQEMRRLARFVDNIKILTLCGGAPMKPQILSLEHRAHIVVGTPGRIGDHLRRKTLDLRRLTTLVLDEADRMLDMGFEKEINEIASYVPKKRQTLLFSATFSQPIRELSRRFQHNAREVTVESQHAQSVISQRFFQVDWEEKLSATASILWTYKPESTLIFCNTKQQCRDLHEALTRQMFYALTINGDLDQKERTEMLTLFANGSTSVLIATDVAARGLDIKDLSAVINFDMPFEPEVYVHRIGRTGRAGKDGLAFSLLTAKETHRLDDINRFQSSKFRVESTRSLVKHGESPKPPMMTISISGGRKAKIRPGDILGALTGEGGIEGRSVGKIDIFEHFAYVAVDRAVAHAALGALMSIRVKGKRFIARLHTAEGVDETKARRQGSRRAAQSPVEALH